MNNILEGFDFHHLGYATKSIADTQNYFKLLGYRSGNVYKDELQNVNIVFMEKEGSPLIELVESSNLSSPINNILKKNGVTPYHICFEVEDLNKVISELRDQGFILVLKPIQAIALSGRRICYLYNKNFGLLELVEKYI
jgi:methylmalonyl-CoA/ethylmalonyl-CoA epimerase